MVLLVLVAWGCWLSLPSLRGSLCDAFYWACGLFCGGCSIYVGVARRKFYGHFTTFSRRGAAAGGVQLRGVAWALILGGWWRSLGVASLVDRLGGWAWFLGFCGGAVTVSGAVPWVLGCPAFAGL